MPELPQPDQISQKEKQFAMTSYMMMFISMYVALPLPLINLLGSIIYYHKTKRESPFVAFHAYQSLLGQIPISIMNGFLVFWFIFDLVSLERLSGRFLIYLLIVFFCGTFYLIISIIAAYRANKGHLYYMGPLGKMAYERFFGENAVIFEKKNETKEFVNRPPGS